jgi:hypothetical protein
MTVATGNTLRSLECYESSNLQKLLLLFQFYDALAVFEKILMNLYLMPQKTSEA